MGRGDTARRRASLQGARRRGDGAERGGFAGGDADRAGEASAEAAWLRADPRDHDPTAQIQVAAFEDEGTDLGSLVGSCACGTGDRVLRLAADRWTAEPTPSLRGLELDVVDGGMPGEVERRLDRPAGARRCRHRVRGRHGAPGPGCSLAGFDLPARRWELVDAVAGARREILRSLEAIDLVLCEHEGLPCPGAPRPAAEGAADLRGAYARFRDDIEADSPPDPEDVRRRLRSAGNAIARLLGREISAAMPLGHRMAVRQIQRRILAFLRSVAATEEGSPTAGLRTYQDLASLADLMLASSRSEDDDRLSGAWI
jgi:hypothetical protein